ncbi:hypothetical protein GCM10007092_12250 [Thermus composti]|uniref:Zinc finger-like domain-containing protein n=1 Tax=Thermus composti TaxID=532059 RepID=A0ABV6Q085_9DEIN|nr:zinc finger-like domain-containing protein [Thermus composti]GGM99839.1 hypothetical protein GCM10007092_12250 [Thermus composti]
MKQAVVRVKSKRKVPCAVCGGEGFVPTEWFAFQPVPGSETECPECEGLGTLPELLEEISGPEPQDGRATEFLAEWVRAYRKARGSGLPPEEARRAAESEVWGFEELPF